MPAPSWAPTVSDVGGVLHARTMGEFGAEEGTFTTTTRPTAAQVTAKIAEACRDIEADLTIPDELAEYAGDVAKVGAAIFVEISFFPNQVGDDPDLLDALQKLYASRLARLTAAVADYNSSSSESFTNTSTFANGGFPGVVGTTLGEGY